MKKNNFVVRYRAFFLIAALFSGVLLSCAEKEEDLLKPKTITDIILQNDQFSILREIIKGVGMQDALRTGDVTLFAPNDAAFRKSGITAATVIALRKDSAVSFVNYHILKDYKKFSDLKTENITALNHRVLIFRRTGDSTVTVNGALITIKNFKADNGVIHVVDNVLTKK